MGYFGTMLEQRMDETTDKPTSKERSARAKRQRVLDQVLGIETKKQYADPADMFR